jgi:hypothetical protein
VSFDTPFFRDPAHLWLAIFIGAFSFLSSLIAFTVIVLFVFRRHEEVEAKLYAQILVEAKTIVEPATRYVGGVARQYDAIRKVLRDHDTRLRKLEGDDAPRATDTLIGE